MVNIESFDIIKRNIPLTNTKLASIADFLSTDSKEDFGSQYDGDHPIIRARLQLILNDFISIRWTIMMTALDRNDRDAIKLLLNLFPNDSSLMVRNAVLVSSKSARLLEILELPNVDLNFMPRDSKEEFYSSRVLCIAKLVAYRGGPYESVALLKAAHVKQFCREALAQSKEKLEQLIAAHAHADITLEKCVECYIEMAKSSDDEIAFLKKAIEPGAGNQNALFAYLNELSGTQTITRLWSIVAGSPMDIVRERIQNLEKEEEKSKMANGYEMKKM